MFKNRKTRISVIIVLLVIVLYLINTMQQKSIKTADSDGKVLEKVHTLKKPQQQKPKASNNTTNFVKDAIKDTKPQPSKELSYSELYTMYKLAEDCSPLLQRLKWLNESQVNENEPQSTEKMYSLFDDYIGIVSKHRQVRATQKQKDTLGVFIVDCEQLERQTKEYTKPTAKIYAESLSEKIRIKMRKTPVKSAEEKQIKAVLALTTKARDNNKEILGLFYGEYTLNTEEIKHIKNEIQAIGLRLSELAVNNANNSTSSQFINLRQQLVEKEKHLKSSRKINRPLIEEKIKESVNLIKKINAFQHSQYASAFKEAHDYLGSQDIDESLWSSGKFSFPKQETLKDTIANKIKLTDTHYLEMAYDAAIELYLCYLGANCSEDSSIIRNYCIGNAHDLSMTAFNKKMYKEACGLTLDNFYIDFYISLNQLKDVNRIFNLLVQNNAQ